MAAHFSPNSMQSTDPLLTLRDISAGYGRADVILGATLTVQTGAAVAISGPTGAGKTTLARVMAGQLRPRRGHVRVMGGMPFGPQGRALRQQVGLIPQTPQVLAHASVRDNAALPLRLAGRPERSYRTDLNELLDFTGLALIADLPAGTLSAGEVRKLALARALAIKPRLIVADEPTAGLGREAGVRLVRLLAELRKVGTAIVVLTQDPSLGPPLGALAMTLADGQLTQGPATTEGAR